MDEHERLPRGALEISRPRELLVERASHFAREPDGSTATDTLSDPRLAFGYGLTPTGAPIELDPVETHTREAVWGGYLVGHFGHFLTESVTRLWPLIPGGELEGLPVVFGAERDLPFVSEWRDGFGIETIALPTDGVVKFARLIVPERSWRLGSWIAPEIRDTHLHARAGMQIPPAPYRDVLWLSRSRLQRERAALDERLLEWVLADHITPVHLETMDLGNQIGVLENSRGVAGVLGSAFHTLLMTEHPPDCLYLCSAAARTTYIAQHRLLSANATFAKAMCSEARMPHLRRQGHALYFPAGHRVMVPEALAALASTLLPELSEDPRIAIFANPGRPYAQRLDEIDAAALDVIRNPWCAAARRGLGAMFEERSLHRCAEEQLDLAEYLEPVGA